MASSAQSASLDTAPELGRRERNKRAKQARIIKVARELFSSKGFAETTTAEIANAADIGTGTLFLYVRSKEDLLVQVFKEEMMGTLRALFTAASAEETAAAQMMSVFEGMFDYHSRDVEVSKVLLKEIHIPSSSERVTDMEELIDAVHAGLVKIAGASNAFGPEDAELTGHTAFAIYYYSLVSWIGGARQREEALSLLRAQLNLLLGKD